MIIQTFNLCGNACEWKAEGETEAAKTTSSEQPRPAKKQTWPEPTIPICELFANGIYPQGEILEHPQPRDLDKSVSTCTHFVVLDFYMIYSIRFAKMNSTTAMNRMTSEEKRALDLAQTDFLRDLRQAAEAHRQTRKYVQSWLKPGLKMFDIA